MFARRRNRIGPCPQIPEMHCAPETGSLDRLWARKEQDPACTAAWRSVVKPARRDRLDAGESDGGKRFSASHGRIDRLTCISFTEFSVTQVFVHKFFWYNVDQLDVHRLSF